MNVLALCAGIGGLELGIKLAHPPARCVCYVEGEAYAAAVLVRRMEEGCLDEAPVWSDVKTFDGKPWCGVVDCVSAGYPCQPFSIAGKRLGEDDPRHLWPDISRIVREVRPSLCFFENVPHHLRLGFKEVRAELCSMGYRVAAGLFTAEEVGAPHKRERLYIMAHSDRSGLERPKPTGTETSQQPAAGRLGQLCAGLPTFPPRRGEAYPWSESYPILAESSIRRVDDGSACTPHRIRSLGNSVVPLVAAYAWTTLATALHDVVGCF